MSLNIFPGMEKLTDKPPARRVIMNIQGLEKCGKTHLALTGPPPIAYFGFDIGLEGVGHKFAGSKDIYAMEFRIPQTAAGPEYVKTWEQFVQAYKATINNKKIRTIVVDTATEAWELARLARLGKLSGVQARYYGPLNAEFREIIRLGYDVEDKNVIFIHKLKDEYAGENKTGKLERAGFKDVGYLVQMNVACSRNRDGQFVINVIDCRQNMTLCGMEFPGEAGLETIIDMVNS